MKFIFSGGAGGVCGLARKLAARSQVSQIDLYRGL
jgi:hypothetical protein